MEPLNDWEIDEVKNLLLCLSGTRVIVDVEDRVRWAESNDGTFSVKALYKALRVKLNRVFSNEDNMELYYATKSKLLCFRSVLGKSSNFGPSSKEGGL